MRTENDNSPSYTDLIKTYESKMQEYKAQFIEGERFIADIEDSYLQQALFLRFIKGEKWQKIAVLLGGGNTADGVRKACCRYIRDFRSASAGLLFTSEPDKTRQNLIKLEALARVRVKNRPHEGKYFGAYLVLIWCLFWCFGVYSR